MLVISPHLDDAVLSCGRLLVLHPGAMVATLFAGTPRDAGKRTVEDTQRGFGSAAQALRVRCVEDARALTLLGAWPHWLDFVDDQYGEPVLHAELVQALVALIRARPREPVLYPLGLFHRDHRIAHEATAEALRLCGRAISLVYEDVPYRAMPGLLRRRVRELEAQGVAVAAARLGPRDHAEATKAAAVAAYASRMRGLGARGMPDAVRPERLWRLDRTRSASA